jgi:hypothetical protein
MLDQDQKAVLYVYSLYSSEDLCQYLQYTAALVVFYYLMKKGHFPQYQEQLLVYDYKDSRRFVWEDKKFMADINIIRDHDFLNRARINTKNYRDINTHQITREGQAHLKEINYAHSEPGQKIRKELTCKCKRLFTVRLDDDIPRLVCPKCKTTIPVEGFLKDLNQDIHYQLDVSFI